MQLTESKGLPRQSGLHGPIRYFSTTYGHLVRRQPTLSIEREDLFGNAGA